MNTISLKLVRFSITSASISYDKQQDYSMLRNSTNMKTRFNIKSREKFVNTHRIRYLCNDCKLVHLIPISPYERRHYQAKTIDHAKE